MDDRDYFDVAVDKQWVSIEQFFFLHHPNFSESLVSQFSGTRTILLLSGDRPSAVALLPFSRVLKVHAVADGSLVRASAHDAAVLVFIPCFLHHDPSRPSRPAGSDTRAAHTNSHRSLGKNTLCYFLGIYKMAMGYGPLLRHQAFSGAAGKLASTTVRRSLAELRHTPPTLVHAILSANFEAPFWQPCILLRLWPIDIFPCRLNKFPAYHRVSVSSINHLAATNA